MVFRRTQKKRIEQEMKDANETLDKEAMKRPRSTDDPRPDDTVEPETKKAGQPKMLLHRLL